MRFSRAMISMGPRDAPVRVVFVPHAGGSAMSYLPLARTLPDSCETHLVEPAGRGSRYDEPFPENFAAAVAALRAEVAPLLDRPTVIVGHSLGGLLAHELVSTLPTRAVAWVAAVVVSASRSPVATAAAATHPPAPFVRRTRRQLVDELRTRGGCPAEVFTEPDMLDNTIRVLGHDLHLADTYLAPAADPADVPYHLWFGRDDPFVDPATAHQWSPSLARSPSVRAFPGDHFYLSARPEPVAALRDLLDALDERVWATAG